VIRHQGNKGTDGTYPGFQKLRDKGKAVLARIGWRFFGPSALARSAGAGNHDQVHVIRHQAVAQQGKSVEFGTLPQQLEIGDPVCIVSQNHLPGVAALGNMMNR
jgi:hypothetical protein